MKISLYSILVALTLTSTTHAYSSIAESRTVAKCGSYILSQEPISSYFAGIKHTQDGYTLTDADGNEEEMEISLNSEGATFKSSYIPAGLSITAVWDQFELSVNTEKRQENIKCLKL